MVAGRGELSVIAISKLPYLLVHVRSEATRLDSPLMAHLCFQLPTSSSAAVQARPVAVKDIAGLIRERYGGCRISSSVRRLMSKGPAPLQIVAPWEISAETQSQPWPGDRQSGGSHTSF